MTYRDYFRYTRGNNGDTERMIGSIRENLKGLVKRMASEATLDALETLRAAAINQPENFDEALDSVTRFVMDGFDIMGEQEPENGIGDAAARVILNNLKLFEEISGLTEDEHVGGSGD